MGQQQLLLLVLGAVIVGVAVVAGIEAFHQNVWEMRRDLAIQESLDMAARMKARRLKPRAVRGPNAWPASFEELLPGSDEADGRMYNTAWGHMHLSDRYGDVALIDVYVDGAPKPNGRGGKTPYYRVRVPKDGEAHFQGGLD